MRRHAPPPEKMATRGVARPPASQLDALLTIGNVASSEQKQQEAQRGRAAPRPPRRPHEEVRGSEVYRFVDRCRQLLERHFGADPLALSAMANKVEIFAMLANELEAHAVELAPFVRPVAPAEVPTGMLGRDANTLNAAVFVLKQLIHANQKKPDPGTLQRIECSDAPSFTRCIDNLEAALQGAERVRPPPSRAPEPPAAFARAAPPEPKPDPVAEAAARKEWAAQWEAYKLAERVSERLGVLDEDNRQHKLRLDAQNESVHHQRARLMAQKKQIDEQAAWLHRFASKLYEIEKKVDPTRLRSALQPMPPLPRAPPAPKRRGGGGSSAPPPGAPPLGAAPSAETLSEAAATLCGILVADDVGEKRRKLADDAARLDRQVKADAQAAADDTADARVAFAAAPRVPRVAVTPSGPAAGGAPEKSPVAPGTMDGLAGLTALAGVAMAEGAPAAPDA